MSNKHRVELFDLHFTGLCLFAVWTDGELSLNERDYLTDLLWINMPQEEGLKYDFDFEARRKIANSIEVINQTFPNLNEEHGGAAPEEVASALVALFSKVEQLLNNECSFSEAEVTLFFTELQKNYLGLGLADGHLADSEKVTLELLGESFPRRFQFLASYQAAKESLEKKQQTSIALSNLRPRDIFENSPLARRKPKGPSETLSPTSVIIERTMKDAGATT